MIGSAWWLIVVLLLLVSIWTRQGPLFLFSLLLLFGSAASALWARYCLAGLRYRRALGASRLNFGEETEITVEITNAKPLPLAWLRIHDEWPAHIPLLTGQLGYSHKPERRMLENWLAMRWYERVRRVYRLRGAHRGAYAFGPAELTSGDLFGMYETSRVSSDIDHVVIFPELLPLKSLPLPTQDPFGEKRSPRWLFEDPTQAMAIRPYQPADGFRQIHWPATARTGELQVRVYQPISARVLMLCLNATTQPMYWLGVDPGMLEFLIKATATLAYQGILDGYAVGLLSNGCLAHSDRPFHLPPGRSTDHLAQLLTALAAVTPFTTAPFENYLVQSMPRVPFGASLLVISASVTPALCASLVQINRYRASTTLVSLGNEIPVAIPGIRVVNLDYPGI